MCGLLVETLQNRRVGTSWQTLFRTSGNQLADALQNRERLARWWCHRCHADINHVLIHVGIIKETAYREFGPSVFFVKLLLLVPTDMPTLSIFRIFEGFFNNFRAYRLIQRIRKKSKSFPAMFIGTRRSSLTKKRRLKILWNCPFKSQTGQTKNAQWIHKQFFHRPFKRHQNNKLVRCSK